MAMRTQNAGTAHSEFAPFVMVLATSGIAQRTANIAKHTKPAAINSSRSRDFLSNLDALNGMMP
jgi:hypothetical protein